MRVERARRASVAPIANALRALSLGLIALALVTIARQSACAETFDAAAYFKDKTITFVVDFKAGGGTDVQARYFAAHFGKFIPGEPRITVTNLFPLPAGRNFVWQSKPDGLTLSFLATADVGTELVDTAAHFKSDQFEYIGSHTGRDLMLYVSKAVPYKTYKDAKGGKAPVILAQSASQPGELSDLSFAAGLLALWLDAPLQIVPVASAGTADSLLMVERGDINGFVGGAMWYQLSRTRPGWLKSGFLRPIADMSNPDEEPKSNGEVSPTLPNVVTWFTPEQKEEWLAMVMPQVLTGKAIAAPPGTPAPVVKALRDAYVAALNDPEFAKGVEKIQREPIALIPGDKLQKMVETTHAAFAKAQPLYKKLQADIFKRYVKTF